MSAAANVNGDPSSKWHHGPLTRCECWTDQREMCAQLTKLRLWLQVSVDILFLTVCVTFDQRSRDEPWSGAKLLNICSLHECIFMWDYVCVQPVRWLFSGIKSIKKGSLVFIWTIFCFQDGELLDEPVPSTHFSVFWPKYTEFEKLYILQEVKKKKKYPKGRLRNVFWCPTTYLVSPVQLLVNVTI